MDYEEFLNHKDDYIDGLFFDSLSNKQKPKAKKMDYTPYIPELKHARNDLWLEISKPPEERRGAEDRVNSPKHYTYGKAEAIDVIEAAIDGAPSQAAGFNHGQVLKYLLRLWKKDNSSEDAQKAEWYLKRLIKELEE